MKGEEKECPHCGSVNGYRIETTFRGVNTDWIDWSGEHIEGDNSFIYGKTPKTGICVDCNKKVKHLSMEERKQDD